jgi:dTDP-4-amino-4,6-dideoxygalactose transaminase
VRFHYENRAATTIGTHRRTESVQFGVVETGLNGQITQYKEKPSLDYMVSMGIYVFSPNVREYIPRGQKFDFPELVQRLLAKGQRVMAYESDAYWLDIGRPDDYQKANEEFPNMEKLFLNKHVKSAAVGTEFDERELEAVLATLDSEWITAGPRTEAFEKAFAGLAGTSDAVAVSNGTAALFLALRALGIGPGDEVLCPSLTFVATAAAVLHCGATPVLVDICSFENPTMDPDDAASKITSRTKAILPVHYAGIPADMDRLCELAAIHGLFLVEDAAHAPGARFAGKACGSFGAAGCFSFFGNKNMTTAEGGMITTSDPELAKQLRLLRSHDMTVTSWDREKGRPAHYDVVEFGFNFRFDDIRAALGLAQLEKLPRLNQRRAELVERYNAKFSEMNSGLAFPLASADRLKEPACHIYPVVFRSPERRDAVSELLKQEGIQTGIHYPPIHHFTAFRIVDSGVDLPVTEAFASRELTLPLYPSLTEAQVDEIVSCTLRKTLAQT